MNAIKNKIRSRKGASITFALLIFMVCAILSTVVIVAASTASGRMSQIAQSDQMYYAVTSAAGLLRDDIDGTTVTVEYEEDDSGKYVANTAEAVLAAGSEKKIIDEATELFVQQMAGGSVTSPVFGLVVDSVTVGEGESAVTTDFSKLDCQIKETVKEDGRLIFEICHPSVSASKYTLQIIFNANVSQSSSQITDEEGNITNKVTAVVTWTFSGVRKGALTT